MLHRFQHNVLTEFVALPCHTNVLEAEAYLNRCTLNQKSTPVSKVITWHNLGGAHHQFHPRGRFQAKAKRCYLLT